jgi:hypothetical protein
LVAIVLYSGLAGGAAPPRISEAAASGRGDVNCDKAVDPIDVALVLQVEAGLLHGLPCDVGDVNHDGLTNSIDSSFVLQRVAELIPALPALVSLNIETAQPVAVGDEVIVDVNVEDVEHLAAYQVRLSYNQSLLTFERIDDSDGFYVNSPRKAELICSNQLDFTDLGALIGCVTNDAPVCLGGAPGPSGSGTLARFVFTAQEAGSTSIEPQRVTLISDDIWPCDRTAPTVRLIPQEARGAELVILPAPTSTP